MMVTQTNTIINKCVGCQQKKLLLHNKIMSCESCGKIVRSECARLHFEYYHLTNSWQCLECKAKPSALFCNIDGNASNCDSFVTDISQYCHEFSCIGIAETNIDPRHKKSLLHVELQS